MLSRAEMRKIWQGEGEARALRLPRVEAIIKFMEEREEPYIKVELINDLPEDATISFYKQGEFTDLCAGPYLDSTGRVKAQRHQLMNVTGAYWRGDSSSKDAAAAHFTGTAFPKKDELEFSYLNMLEEAKKRDHRKLGKELRPCSYADDSRKPGFPFFLPTAATLQNTRSDYWREVHKRYGYVAEVSTPMILNCKPVGALRSWDHYKQNMYNSPSSMTRITQSSR